MGATEMGGKMKNVTWTITAPAQPWPTTNAEASDQFWAVEDCGTSPDRHHDARHFASQSSALNFLFGHKMKIGDTIKMGDAEEGRTVDVLFVRQGERIHYDVGTHVIPTPEELIRYLDALLQPGDTVRYLHN